VFLLISVALASFFFGAYSLTSEVDKSRIATRQNAIISIIDVINSYSGPIDDIGEDNHVDAVDVYYQMLSQINLLDKTQYIGIYDRNYDKVDLNPFENVPLENIDILENMDIFNMVTRDNSGWCEFKVTEEGSLNGLYFVTFQWMETFIKDERLDILTFVLAKATPAVNKRTLVIFIFVLAMSAVALCLNIVSIIIEIIERRR
jgi:hypothetical protein